MKFLFILQLLACSLCAQVLNPYVSHPKLPQFKDGVSVGNLTSTAAWQELSGLASPTVPANANYMWILSDGPTNQLACVSRTDASNQGVWSFQSPPTFSDVEDIQSAKINGVSYIYFLDTGDNANARATFFFIRAVEPTITGSNGTISSGNYITVTCEYPAGSLPTHKDCELTLVDPDTGDLYFITKRESVPGVYYLAHAATYTGTQTLTDLGNMYDIPDVTTQSQGASAMNVVGGCISRSGQEIYVKNYNDVYYFARPNKAVSIYTTLTQTPVAINYVGGGSVTPAKSHPTQEPQGEAVSLDYEQQNLYTVSEWNASAGSTTTRYPLFRYDRIGAVPTTITFQEGVSPSGAYAGTLDTYIWDTQPTTDQGAGASMVVDTAVGVETDQRKGLLKFDISAIPTTAKVVSATLELYINTEGQGWKFHKMLVTWNEASTYNSLTTGVDNDGVEAAVANDCLLGLNLDTITGTVRCNMALATVQDWVTNPANNFGWLLEQVDSTTGDGVQLDTAEGATASRRPKLIIKYN